MAGVFLMDAKDKEELSELVSNAARAAVKAELEQFQVPAEQHYLDHQLVGGVREGVKTSRKAAFYAMGAASVGGMAYAVKMWLTALIGKGGP
jgi:hypothetical protein